MNVLIIEDEQLAAARLEKLITNIDDSIKIITIIDSIEGAVEWFKNNPHPDLIFLDIQLSDGLSFNIFKQVEVNSPVIFTTAYDKYALKAFEINSIDYLLKPIDTEKLELSIEKYNKLKNNFSSTSTNVDLNKFLSEFSINAKTFKSRFLINKGDALLIVDVNKIAYFYSEQKASFIVTKDDHRYILNDSLDSIIEDVDPALFYRINRQFVVSAGCIAKINTHFNYKLKLDLFPPTDNDNTIISRTKVKEFKEWLAG